MSNQEHEKAKVSQSILLICDEKVLILKHKSGKWLLPGGRLNTQENWKDGLLREIKEETGIGEVEIVGVLEVDNWKHEGEPHYGIFLHGIPSTNKVTLSEEHSDFAWVTRENIKSYEFWNESLQDRVARLTQKVFKNRF